MKRALIVGGATGIGRAAATALARDGVEVHVVDLNEADGRATVEEIRGAAGKADFWTADISDEQALAGAFDDATSSGAPDFVFVSAGIEYGGPTVRSSFAAARRVIDVNLFGSFAAATLAMERMAGAGGSIVLTSSVHSRGTIPGFAAYAAAKGGIDALTRALALEGGPLGVRVNSVLPAATDTPMLDRELEAGGEADAVRQRMGAGNPLGRIATAAEVAQVAIFLGSEAASFVNGVSVPVDGGILAAVGSMREMARFPVPQIGEAGGSR
ncbi:MAG TPA: SDR family NAD(P)-dependent oxidoreductase [Solirubrobacterales bacterium]